MTLIRRRLTPPYDDCLGWGLRLSDYDKPGNDFIYNEAVGAGLWLAFSRETTEKYLCNITYYNALNYRRL